MDYPLHAQPVAEYCRVIYEAWDKDPRPTNPPPKGYNTWMEFWYNKYTKEQSDDSTLKCKVS